MNQIKEEGKCLKVASVKDNVFTFQPYLKEENKAA